MVQRSRLSIVFVILSLSVVLSATLMSPAHGQDSDGFHETFDRSSPSGWGFASGASVSGGALRLENDGEAWHGGDWDNLTLTIRLRRQAGGVTAFRYRDTGDQSYLVLVGDDLVSIQRRKEGNSPTEIGTASPVSVPVNRWFELSIMSLGGGTIVGLDGERVATGFDPNGELPPGGIAFYEREGGVVEIDEVTLTPWFVEDFEGPLGNGWTQGRVEDGALQMSPQTWVSYGDDWSDMTLIAQVRWSGQAIPVLGYHVTRSSSYLARLDNQTVAITREVNGTVEHIANATAPRPADSEEWTFVGIIVEGGQHTVLMNDLIVLQVTDPDPLSPGSISLESAEGNVEIGWVAVGPPIPLPKALPDGGTPPGGGNQPGDNNPPGGGQPPAGVCSVSSSQNVNIRSGPDTTYNVIGTLFPGTYLTVNGRSSNGWWRITFSGGQGWVAGSAVQTRGNCSNIPQVSGPAQPPAQTPAPQPTELPPPPGGGEWGILTTDVAVTDIFPDSMPYGTVNFRLTNRGPSALNNVAVTVRCWAEVTLLEYGDFQQRLESVKSYNLNLAEGQTEAFSTTTLTMDSTQFSYDVTCVVQPDFNDPDSSNNSELIQTFANEGGDSASWEKKPQQR